MQILIQILLSATSAGVITAIVNQIFQRRIQTAAANKTDAERQDIIANAATKAVELVSEQLNRAEARITELEAEIARMRSAHAADIARHVTKIAQYELELTMLRSRVTELERELKQARERA